MEQSKVDLRKLDLPEALLLLVYMLSLILGVFRFAGFTGKACQ
jgi:hypothetical protein